MENVDSAIDSLTETLNIFPEDFESKERLSMLTQKIEKVS